MFRTIKQHGRPQISFDAVAPTVRTAGDSGPDPKSYPFLLPAVEADEIGRLGGYRVLRLLGQGGMGYVFQAEDVSLRRPVALKVMKPDQAPDAGWERFLREARLMASIKHDHVVTVFQVGQEGRVPYLAMELLRGRSLEDWTKQAPKIGGTAVVRLGRQIAAGLAVIHGSGLIHRDLKPANIWLEAPKARVKILDFGLARFTEDDAHLTQTGMIVGTPSYMSPEQARGETLDARSDLFSLGCVLYELCCGARPFQAPTTMAVLTALAVSNPKPIREVRPTVPEDLSDLVMQLLAKDPADRPATAEAVVARLQKIEGRLNARPTVRSPSAALADAPAPSPASGSATHVDRPARPKTPTPKRPTRARKTRPARRRRTIQFLALGLAAAGLAIALAVGLAFHFASAPGGSAAVAASPAFLSDLPLIEDHNPIKAPPLPPGLPEPPPFTGVRVHNRPASHGIFMHPPMQPEGGTAGLSYKLGGMYARFGAEASLNDGPPESMTPLTFTVRGDGRILWQSHPIRRQDDAERCEVSVRGVDVVTIEVNCPGDPRGAHAVWIEPEVAP